MVERSRRGVWGPVLIAIGLDFALQRTLGAPHTAFGSLASTLIGAAIAVLYGTWLGRRAWPKRGRALTRRLLLRAARDKKAAPVLVLTDRHDASIGVPRRVFEVIGFAAGTAVLVGAVFSFLGAATLLAFISTGFIVVVTLWLSWILVPYWLFARMGLRHVDVVRWTVVPMSRRYAERLRLSNGALLLIALGATVNLAFRAGASGDEALIAGVLLVGRVVASVLVVAVAAVAFYLREEPRLVRELEEVALEAGIRDGRALTDGDFLPRLGARG